jgi:mRNA deadenylase 3'-5' endonuclease subunit Ccr4
MKISVNVIGQRMKLATNIKCLVSGSKQFIKFIFNMDSNWDNLLTYAQFRQNDVVYNRYLDKDNSVYLPNEIIAGTCELVLCGTHNGIRATTNCLTLTIDENILVADN